MTGDEYDMLCEVRAEAESWRVEAKIHRAMSRALALAAALLAIALGVAIGGVSC